MPEQFHFLRPEWFYAILPLLIITGLLLRWRLFSHNWQSVVDEKLLPHLLVNETQKNSVSPVLILFAAGLLAITALAGPAWEKLPQPVFKKQSALLIALDLSRSMDAIDLSPSRLIRARYKVSDILQRRKEGQTGLVVYAADAYTVTPLSDDTQTISALLPSLTTDIMPAEGSNAASALNKAVELMNHAGFSEGDILLVTDSIDKATAPILEATGEHGFRVSMLAVGTQDGAPIPLKDGGFAKDESGQVLTPKLPLDHLRTLITGNDGIFSQLSTDDSDIEKLMPLISISTHQGETVETEIQTEIWREFGPWLLVLLLPLAALSFRRGYLMLACFLLLPVPQPAQAETLPQILSDLWVSDNERAMLLYKDQKYDEAAELFDDKQWKASAYYRARQYELSIRQLQAFDVADAHYNRGNALTRQSEIAEAIKAYTAALEIDPDHEDAKYNKALLEKLQQEQQQGQQKSQNPDQQEEDDSKDSEATDGGSAENMNPEPKEDEQEEKPTEEDQPKEEQQEETPATENPSNNEDPKQTEPGESKDKSDSSSESKPDEKQREDQQREDQQREEKQQQQSQDQGSKKQQEQDKDQSQDKDQQEQIQPEQQNTEPKQEEEPQAEKDAEQKNDTAEQQPLSDQAVEQWLNKVEDDPGGLLRRKFKYLYQRQQQQNGNQ
jgi:Ca-activated chloride channel family protein